MSKVAHPRAARLLAIRKVLNGMVTQLEGLRNYADATDDFRLRPGTDASITFTRALSEAMLALADAEDALTAPISDTYIRPDDLQTYDGDRP